MKKAIAAVLVWILLFGCCACGAEKSGAGENGKDILLTFRQFLDGEGFVAGLSESDLIDRIVPRYSYEGKTIVEHAGGGLNWDGVEAEGECYGWSATEERFGASWAFFHAWTETSFFTTVALEGLTLPFGLCFGDSRPAVLQKIGLAFDPGNDAAIPADGILLLSEDGMELRYGEAGENAPYRLTFSETAAGEENGRITERALDFWLDDAGLVRFKVSVMERRER